MKLNARLLKTLALIGVVGFLASSCKDDEPQCTAPVLTNMFIVSGGTGVEMTNDGGGDFSYNISNFGADTYSFVFANNASATNATFGIASGSTTSALTGTAVQKVVDGATTCGNNAPFNFTGMRGKNIEITFNATSKAYTVTAVDFNPCTDYAKNVCFTRWRNNTNAADFFWAPMTPVANQPGVFTISQPASRFYLDGATTPNFGAQVIEFSNQADYGGLRNGQLWQLYRNLPSDWDLPRPVNGATSRRALSIPVYTTNAQGVQTIVCPAASGATSVFRLQFNPNNEGFIIQRNNTLRYVFDTRTGELAIFIE